MGVEVPAAADAASRTLLPRAPGRGSAFISPDLRYCVAHQPRASGEVHAKEMRLRLHRKCWRVGQEDFGGRVPVERALPFARERDIPEHVVRLAHRESEAVELWDEFRGVKSPVLIVTG